MSVIVYANDNARPQMMHLETELCVCVTPTREHTYGTSLQGVLSVMLVVLIYWVGICTCVGGG